MKNYIDIGNKTLQIIKQGHYTIGDQTISLCPGEYDAVEVYSPERIRELRGRLPLSPGCIPTKSGVIEIVNADSYEAARGYSNVMVMNFANESVPGGGFRMGATAQEESLCRNSTLYASIASERAKEMYRYNRTHPSPIPSEYMLFSRDVCVFRDADCNLLSDPYSVSVITIPAPNRRGLAVLTKKETLKAAMEDRIRIMLEIAIEQGCDNLVLGAWGCGAFGHSAEDVAGYFKTVLIDKNYKTCFDKVIFAILHGQRDGKIEMFQKMLCV